MELNEVRKEDDYYLNGNYWIIANSVSDILKGQYEIMGSKHYVDYSGKVVDESDYYTTHQQAWNALYKDKYNVEYTYYPRGRVTLYKGKLYINTHSLVSNGNIIGDVLEYYDLANKFKLSDIEIVCNDKQIGNEVHYGFELE